MLITITDFLFLITFNQRVTAVAYNFTGYGEDTEFAISSPSNIAYLLRYFASERVALEFELL